MDLKKTLEGEGKILVLAHHNADIDAVGASIALKECLGDRTDIAVPDSVSKGAKDLAEGYNFLKNPDTDAYETVIVVDCPSAEQLGSMDIGAFDGKKILIDHHSPGNLSEIVDKNITEPDAKSTSEIVYELLKDDWELNEEAGKALICGMVADTSHLKMAGEKQFRYISELLENCGCSYSDILSILSTPIDRSERIARLKAASRIDGYKIDNLLIVFSSVGSFEAASARALLRLGADVAIVFSPRDNEMRVSGRCRRNLTDDLHLGDDVFSEVENVLDGSAGGHDAAASGNGKNTDIQEIRNAMLKRLEEVFGQASEEL